MIHMEGQPSVPISEQAPDRKRDQDKSLMKAAQQLARAIEAIEPNPEFGMQPQALIVGGYVRDLLAGGHPKDADLEVYGVSVENLEATLVREFGANVNLVGKAFGIFKVSVAPGIELDVSIPRRESKIGPKHRDIKVQGDPSMSIVEAARRRDFSMNTLTMHPTTGEMNNPFGGKEDIEAKRLRVTDPERFQDDPLRVMRAVQFIARMELSVDPESMRLMQEMVVRGDLSELPAERMIEEWKKMLVKGKKPSLGVMFMRDAGILARHYPELTDVSDALAAVLDRGSVLLKEHETEEKFQVLFAVVMAHASDVGKFLVHFESEDAKKKGKKGQMASVRKEEVDAMVASARGYGRISEIAEVKDSREYLNRARMAVRDSKAPAWLLHDVHAVMMPEASEARERFTRMAEEHSIDVLAKSELLRGQDLLDRGQKPGKFFRDIIVKAEALRDAGDLETRDQALTWLDAELKRAS